MPDVWAAALYTALAGLAFVVIHCILEWPPSKPRLYKFKKANIWGYGASDVKVVYHEMFEMKTRLSNSVVLRPNDVVIDGGANVGMFSLSMLMGEATPGVTVHAFEPMPPTYEAAVRNLASYPQVKLYNLGLSNANREEKFHWSPAATCNAAPYHHIMDMNDATIKKSRFGDVVLGYLQTNENAGVWPKSVCKFLTWALSVPVLNWIAFAGVAYHIILYGVVLRTLTTKLMNVKLVTVPEMFKLTGVKSVGLMKLDVEGAELEILEGMTEDCWARVDQFWIEVQDVNNRLSVIRDMLTARGYTVTVSKDDLALLDALPIFALFATRRKY